MFENIFGIATIPSIVIICYLVAELVKVTQLDSKYIPIVCGFLGGVLGVLGIYVVPDFQNDIYNAMAIGIVSGFAATGINQIFKQFSKK